MCIFSACKVLIHTHSLIDNAHTKPQQLAKVNKNFHLWFTLDQPGEGWKYSKGFINAEMCAKHLPAASPDTLIFLCGPPPMIKFAALPALKGLGHDARNMIEF